MNEHEHATELRCPVCGKLLGRTTEDTTTPGLLLWCRRCHCEREPVAERPQGA